MSPKRSNRTGVSKKCVKIVKMKTTGRPTKTSGPSTSRPPTPSTSTSRASSRPVSPSPGSSSKSGILVSQSDTEAADVKPVVVDVSTAGGSTSARAPSSSADSGDDSSRDSSSAQPGMKMTMCTAPTMVPRSSSSASATMVMGKEMRLGGAGATGSSGGRRAGGKRSSFGRQYAGKVRSMVRRSLDPSDNSNDSGLGFDQQADALAQQQLLQQNQQQQQQSSNGASAHPNLTGAVNERLCWPEGHTQQQHQLNNVVCDTKRQRIYNNIKVEHDEVNENYSFPENTSLAYGNNMLIRTAPSSTSAPSPSLSNNGNSNSMSSRSGIQNVSLTNRSSSSTPTALTSQLTATSRYGDISLVILCQPEQQHRARYQTEGSRGAVKDRSGNGFPIVRLTGYNKPAALQVFIGTDQGKVSPHMFYQACRVSGKNSTPCSEKRLDGTIVIELQLEPSKEMVATCDCVGILKERNVDVEHRFPDHLGARATKKKSTRCRMVFRTFITHDDGVQETLQVCSHPIVCTQPPGVPEISKKSLTSCPASGGLELFILGKNFLKDTLVVFQLEDDDRNVRWEKCVIPDKEFLQQTHLVCVVPPFMHPEATEPVTVRLYVVSSGKSSEPHQFVYTPVNGAMPSVPSGRVTHSQSLAVSTQRHHQQQHHQHHHQTSPTTTTSSSSSPPSSMSSPLKCNGFSSVTSSSSSPPQFLLKLSPSTAQSPWSSTMMGTVIDSPLQLSVTSGNHNDMITTTLSNGCVSSSSATSPSALMLDQLMPPPDSSLVPLGQQQQRRPSISASENSPPLRAMHHAHRAGLSHNQQLHQLNQEIALVLHNDDDNSQGSTGALDSPVLVQSSQQARMGSATDHRFRHVSESSMDVQPAESNMSLLNENSMDNNAVMMRSSSMMNAGGGGNASFIYSDGSNHSFINENSMDMLPHHMQQQHGQSSLSQHHQHHQSSQSQQSQPRSRVGSFSSRPYCDSAQSSPLLIVDENSCNAVTAPLAMMYPSNQNCNSNNNGNGSIGLLATVATGVAQSNGLLNGTLANAVSLLQDEQERQQKGIDLRTNLSSFGILENWQQQQHQQQAQVELSQMLATSAAQMVGVVQAQQHAGVTTGLPITISTANHLLGTVVSAAPTPMSNERLDAMVNIAVESHLSPGKQVPTSPEHHHHKSTILDDVLIGGGHQGQSAATAEEVANVVNGSVAASADLLLNSQISPSIMCRNDPSTAAMLMGANGATASAMLTPPINLVDPEKAILINAAVDLIETQKKINEMQHHPSSTTTSPATPMDVGSTMTSPVGAQQQQQPMVDAFAASFGKSIVTTTAQSDGSNIVVAPTTMMISASAQQTPMIASKEMIVAAQEKKQQQHEDRMIPQVFTTMTERELINIINPNCFDQV